MTPARSVRRPSATDVEPQKETLIRIERSPDGPVGVDLRTGVLAPRLISRTQESAEVVLVATTATLLGGDCIRIRIEIDDGCRLVLRDAAATVAYDGRGVGARWETTVRVGRRSMLSWHAEPLVVSDGADVDRKTEVEVQAGGRVLLRDTLRLGRVGQTGGSLRCRTRMTYGGRPAVAEDLDLTPEHRTTPRLLAGARVVDTIIALGWEPSPALGTFHLSAGGAMIRRLTEEAHGSGLDEIWRSWSAAGGSWSAAN